ncbi:putative small lipoprotein YifL [Pantoea sp. PA1]|jgi:predicted small lipoprotein YifL|uniref:Lipoprotein n=1 Tax=Pantoea ananatis (strain LMG 20103) TaxID=706191 RepID=D4GIW9_PANAM|nr:MULTISPECIES: hypothetical protein [Pantoea]ADD75714.1 Hypothetical Protein PANA_0547 [Pantoea ananatis LMG 20103]ASN16619.1 hypothetical protein B7764_15990 [Pantoea ananatis]AVG75627.1 hypothetical protein B9Q16_06270 [Pantoea ananatis]KNA30056.1 lipoprotein [Pantoea ananatis]MCH9270071.1 hypothetical protein [Pantoea ananatis]
MKKSMKWFAALAVVGALAGCARTAPLEKIHTIVAAGYTQDQVKNAILRAGVQRQWMMTQVAPGEIKARQQVRDHMAEVRINYSSTGYDIVYDHSTNLLASGGQIHKTYNRWVENLDKDIQANLSAGTKL